MKKDIYLPIHKLDLQDDQRNCIPADAGYAIQKYQAFSIYIESLPPLTQGQNDLYEWQFQIPLQDIQVEHHYFHIYLLKRYYQPDQKQYQYYRAAAGYAVVKNINNFGTSPILLLHVQQIAAPRQGKDGKLMYRFELVPLKTH